MTHTVKVHLTSFEEQNSFLRDVSRFKADINLYEGSQCFDAKSLIAVFSLLLNKPWNVEIITDDDKEIRDFRAAMEKYNK